MTVQVAKAQQAPLPLQEEVEQSADIYRTGHNPMMLWHSALDNYLDVRLDSQLERGAFRPVDGTDALNRFGVSISGQKRFPNVVCYGTLDYYNQGERQRRWNSTRMIDPLNPFILADSVNADFTVDHFNLEGTVAWKPASWVVFGGKLAYEAVSSANQTDPRPHTMGMHFVVTPGVQFFPGHHVVIGLSFSADLMRESIKHTIVDPRVSYQYFRFNGLGDFSVFDSNISGAYPRDYRGTEYRPALQLAWEGGKGLSNHLEVWYAHNAETARDGGVTFTFLGGDHSRNSFGVSERFRIARGRSVHNIEASWESSRTKGIWYEQTSFADPENNNQLTFEVRETQLKNVSGDSEAVLQYRYDLMDGEAPVLTADAGIAYRSSKTVHYGTDMHYRNFAGIDMEAGVVKNFIFGKNLIGTSVRADGRLPLRMYQEVRKKLAASYTDPQLEYLASACAGAGLSFSYYRKISNFWLGAKAGYGYHAHLGKGRYTAVLDQTDRHRIDISLDILF